MGQKRETTSPQSLSSVDPEYFKKKHLDGQGILYDLQQNGFRESVKRDPAHQAHRRGAQWLSGRVLD